MIVNGQDAEPGCYIDGHWGQYGPDRVADICDQFGIELNDQDRPGYWRQLAEEADELGNSHSHWETHVEQSDTLVEELSNRTEGGYWSWEDGEFFLIQTEADRELWVLGHDYDDAWTYLVQRNEHIDIFDSDHAANEAKFGRLEPFRFTVTFHYDPEEA